MFVDDPYHAYYRHKVKEFIEGKAKEPSVPKPAAPTVKVSSTQKALFKIPTK